jgi:hypothetical protein
MDARARSLRKYGLTPADYDQMVEAQNGRCLTCGTDEPESTPRRTDGKVVFRGLAALIAVSLCLVLPVNSLQSPARAWSNGSSGPNSYGTHDWILDK